MKASVTRAALAAAFAASVGAAFAEPVELKFANPGPPQGVVAVKAIQPWVDEVNKAAEGAIAIKVFSGPALASYQNVYDRVVNGVAEFGYGLTGLYPDQFRKTTVAMLPYESRNPHEAAIGLWRIYERGLIADEYARVKLLALPVFTNMSVHAKKPIRTMADLEGVKVASMSRTMSQVIERLGGTPITMSPVELYPAVQRGVVDAVGIGWPGMLPFKLQEVTSYHVQTSLTGEGSFNIMNKDAYAKLPEKGKQAIDRLSGMHASRHWADQIQAMDDGGLALVKSLGQTIITLPPDEEARWRTRAQAVVEEWTKTTPNGAQVLAGFRDEVAKIRAQRTRSP